MRMWLEELHRREHRPWQQRTFFLNIPFYTDESLFYGSVVEDAVVEKAEFESCDVSSKVYVAFVKKSKDTQGLTMEQRTVLAGLGRSLSFSVLG